MFWKKLGKIFDPSEHPLPNHCQYFAQSPQALVFDDFIRIYFSTRAIDQDKKYLSHIAFVDFKKDFSQILQVSAHTIIPLGTLGCFDEHGIFPMNVMRYQNFIYGYTCGWSRRVSVSVETGIGLAVSQDEGLTFQRIGNGPILTASLHEPFLVGDPFVYYLNDTFHMWYIFGREWKKYQNDSPPERIYKIGYATSKNGIGWQKKNEGKQIISDSLGEDESQALPTMIQINDIFHLFFCYRESFDFRKTKGRGYRIGHAYSKDLETWVRDDAQLVLAGTEGEWDSDMQCYPHVFACDGNIYMLYNGNEFGKYGFGLAKLEHG
jgi:hypothetical protein